MSNERVETEQGTTVPDDFWHVDGHHRGSAITARGKDVDRFEFGIKEHIANCRRVTTE